MKYLPLLIAALLRKKVRTLLTLLSVAAAFALFGMLDAVRVAFEAPRSVVGIVVSSWDSHRLRFVAGLRTKSTLRTAAILSITRRLFGRSNRSRPALASWLSP